jgi:activator of HSP90 ATPase
MILSRIHRQMFCGAVVFAAAAGPALAEPSLVHQEVDFASPPARVYAALLDDKQFGALTGAPAMIAPKEGGAFSLFGGAIVGRNVELAPGKRVVQAWRDTAWKPGTYSMVKFELTPRGGGTHLMLDQTGYPDREYHPLSIGWPAHYWTPMKKFFHEKR